MDWNKKGASRYVLLTRRYAFKVPRWSSWQTFLWGLLSNMQERTFSKAGWPELCPILFALPGGFLVVMPRCRPLTLDEFNRVETRIYDAITLNTKGYLVPAEMKPDSWGWHNDLLVAIDYG